jgi:hypothetical protein
VELQEIAVQIRSLYLSRRRGEEGEGYGELEGGGLEQALIRTF